MVLRAFQEINDYLIGLVVIHMIFNLSSYSQCSRDAL